MISDPATILAVLAGLTFGIFALSSWRLAAPAFRFLPPVVWLYFCPMILTTLEVLPSSSPVYDELAKYALPVALILLTVSSNLSTILSVGKPALISLAAGTLGICGGSVAAFFLFDGLLPPDGWQGLILLSASWIGGSANLVAMQQSLQTDAAILGPILVVDTIVAYSWLSILIAMSGQQARIDRFLCADVSILDVVERQVFESSEKSQVVNVRSISVLLGGAFLAAFLARFLGEALPAGSNGVITATTWTVVLVVSFALAASFGRIGKLAREHRAAEFAYAALFLLLASVGAQADLRSIFEAPLFLLAGVVVLAVHFGVVLLTCRLFRIPAFFAAVGSMANVGGAVSAPIAAVAYRPSLAPVGALLGIASYIIGIYVPIGLAFVFTVLAG